MTDLLGNERLVLQRVGAVLFDKDGTIIDAHHYWSLMIRYRAEAVAEFVGSDGSRDENGRSMVDLLMSAMGIDGTGRRLRPEGPVGVKKRSEIASIVGEAVRGAGGRMADSEVENRFAEVDRRTAANMDPLLRLLPGVRGVLTSLGEAQVRVGLVTTDLTDRAEHAMRVLGINRLIDVTLGADAVAATKPAPDLALHALDRVGIAPMSAAVVGDHPVDIQMATAAGCGAAIGVLTGLADRPAFESENCEILQDLTHLRVAGEDSAVGAERS